MRVASVQMSKAYQEMADGKPWDQLTENMRKAILYEHILEQVTERLGSTMQDTTSLRMAQFSASLSDVRTALGQAFLPILYQVLPYLNAMAQALYRVMTVVAAFSRSLFGGGFVYKAPKGFSDVANKDAEAVEAIGDAATGAGSASEKAAKQAKKAWTGLFGFDEVNTITDPTETAGGGAGGGGGGGGGIGGGGIPEDSPMLDGKPFEQTLDELAKRMDRLTQPIKDAYEKVAEYVGEKIADISAWWAEHGAMIKQAATNIVNVVWPILRAIGTYVIDSIKMMIDGGIKTLTGILTFLGGIFTGDWSAAWEGMKMIFFGSLEAIWGFFNLTFLGGIRKALGTFVVSGLKSLVKFVDDAKRLYDDGLKTIGTYWDNLKTGVTNVLTDIYNVATGRVSIMDTHFKIFWDNVATGASNVVSFFKKVWTPVVSWFTRTVINPVISAMEGIADAFSEGAVSGFTYLLNQVIKGINKGFNAINRVKNGLPFADKVPDIPIIPPIPELAQGGITNGPTLAMVGDNVGGREVISPLDRLQGILTNSVVQAMQASNNQQDSGDIVLNVDGRAFARIVKPFLDKEENRLGNDVRIRTI